MKRRSLLKLMGITSLAPVLPAVKFQADPEPVAQAVEVEEVISGGPPEYWVSLHTGEVNEQRPEDTEVSFRGYERQLLKRDDNRNNSYAVWTCFETMPRGMRIEVTHWALHDRTGRVLFFGESSHADLLDGTATLTMQFADQFLYETNWDLFRAIRRSMVPV